MADRDRMAPVVNPPPTENVLTPDMGEMGDARRQTFRPDPETGEVRAGPGDTGLQDRPEVNVGSPGTKQMSTRRLSIGLGIGALLAIIVFILAALF